MAYDLGMSFLRFGESKKFGWATGASEINTADNDRNLPPVFPGVRLSNPAVRFLFKSGREFFDNAEFGSEERSLADW
jgi:hypothetical protein